MNCFILPLIVIGATTILFSIMALIIWLESLVDLIHDSARKIKALTIRLDNDRNKNDR